MVTLVPDNANAGPTTPVTSRVFGVAYEIHTDVLTHLDYREKNGYERVNVKFQPTQLKGEEAVTPKAPFDVIVYVATRENTSFAGHKEIPELAAQIINATGPSGRNRDYVYNLATAFRELFPGEEDEHLFQLEKEVKRQEAEGLRKS